MSDFYDKLYEKPKFKVQEPEPSEPEPFDIDVTDKDALRELSFKALAQVLANGKSDASIVAAARELLDRIDGKAVQQINQSVQGQVQQHVIVHVEYVKARDGREIIDAQPMGGAALPGTVSKSDEGV